MKKQLIEIEEKLNIASILKENDGVVIFKNIENEENNFIIPIEIGREYNKRFYYNKENIEFILEYVKEEPYPFVLVNGILDETRALEIMILEAPFKFTKRIRRLYSIIDSFKKHLSNQNN